MVTNVTFNVECTMPKRWVPYFLGFLHKLQYNGNIGHSSIIGFMADGDGDFNPKFKTDLSLKDYYIANPSISSDKTCEYVYDAG